jgi:hypothetical protein
MLEYWPPAFRAWGSERKMGVGILRWWVYGINVLKIKLKVDSILNKKTHYSNIPAYVNLWVGLRGVFLNWGLRGSTHPIMLT